MAEVTTRVNLQPQITNRFLVGQLLNHMTPVLVAPYWLPI